MSGHSKWSSIKHKKGALDAKRGKLFTKLIREITVAAREGGNNIESNARLRLAVQKGKDANMPADNIERAIKKGTGELEGVSYENVSFEGYGTGGVAVIVAGLTDNRNRTTSEVRSIFAKRGGNMAGAGSVAFQFEKKGIFLVKTDDADEEELMAVAIDSGADDFTSDEDFFQITCPPQDFDKVRAGLLKRSVKIESGELSMIPNNTVRIEDVETARKILALVEELEDNDDVQDVYSNFDIPDEILEEIED
ncbi:MAG: YebC/PmpR family DNA-binding transcriptional regulator [Candidatus Omnitrophica bacterium]|nr:YebC/PmpR family DNA-binding transcriptional regulator [Candidatus Omnitrophota bacterium]MBU1127953.1 YebC/PmpR family DNA-binding transcriptional regulator [Candidatus Omnitrophota bacterium]MBU1657043.1 YebC/PmpR family DNA-binding transcriptional regulator [Candidatus Omnitrophota bacterium]MBU1783943.1 YebC/PmpR family DNA-binding transcriptional regulator [Candidatus Omnitrophota bacterium]MBU1852183.1 YebC/PmpR family DNA-binding transcriptional regulator [Candidatus Omnitrophota bact